MTKNETPKRRRSRTLQVFFASAGEPPWPCDYCGESVEAINRQQGFIHHHDEDKMNDSPENLVAMHPKCHVRHHRKGKPGNRKGVRWSEEMKQHFSEVNRGKPASHGYTAEVRAKQSASMKARKLNGKPHIEAYSHECECGKICPAGPMKTHQRSTGHITVQLIANLVE